MSLCTKHGKEAVDTAGNCVLCYSPIKIDASYYYAPKIPYKCPVCNGTGLVSTPPDIAGDISTWSSSSTATYQCKSCVGQGIIWG